MPKTVRRIKKPNPPASQMPLWVEGGFVNDQSGEATEKLRKQFQNQGNPTLKQFQDEEDDASRP